MAKITDVHRSLIKEVGLCYVATSSSDGTPNVSPKGSIMVLDDDHLVFADIMSPHTRSNLEQNPKIAVYVCKPGNFQGFQFKGAAELSKQGEVYDMLAKAVEERKLNLPPPVNAVKIKVEEVRGLGEA